MIRDDLRNLIDRTSLTEVLDALAGAVFDMEEDDTENPNDRKAYRSIGKDISKASRTSHARKL